jgi:ferrous iron transport protein A
MAESTLNTMEPGQSGTIARIATSLSNVRRRLLELGLTKGTAIELVRFAPMGDPIEVKVKGYRLSLRREEAETVIVDRGNA